MGRLRDNLVACCVRWNLPKEGGGGREKKRVEENKKKNEHKRVNVNSFLTRYFHRCAACREDCTLLARRGNEIVELVETEIPPC